MVEIGGVLFTILVIIIAVWLVIEIVKMRHKIIAVLLIGLVLFTYFSFTGVIDNNDIELKSVSDFVEAGKLYVNWLGTLFNNIKTVTSYAISLDWMGNNSFNKTRLNSSFNSLNSEE